MRSFSPRKFLKLFRSFLAIVAIGIVAKYFIDATLYEVPTTKIFEGIKGLVSIKEFEPVGFDALPAEARTTIGNDPDRYQKHIRGMSSLKTQFFNLRYLSGGVEVEAIVGVPKKLNPAKKYPIIIYNRGGNRELGRLSVTFLKYFDQDFALEGERLFFASQYRGTAGGQAKDEFGGADVDDILNLLNLSKRLSIGDSNNVFMAGHSRGGMMTYLALKRGARVNAAIVLAGVADLEDSERRRPEMGYIYDDLIPELSSPKNSNDRSKILRERSAIYWPEKLKAPVLIIHGDADWRVDVSNAIRMGDAMAKAGKEYKLIVYPGADHSLNDVTDEVNDEIDGWIRRHSR